MFFRWYPTSKAQGPSQTSSCGIWGDQSDTDTFFSNASVFPFSIILLQLLRNIPADVGFPRYKATVYSVAKRKSDLDKSNHLNNPDQQYQHLPPSTQGSSKLTHYFNCVLLSAFN